MTGIRTICLIWTHQLLRTLRQGSSTDLVMAALLRGSALIGLLLLGAATALVIGQLGGRDVVAGYISDLTRRYAVTAVVAVVILDVFFGPRTTMFTAAYRYYPVSLRSLVLCGQMLRLMRVRHLTLALVAFAVISASMGHLHPAGATWSIVFVASVDSLVVMARDVIYRSPALGASVALAGTVLIVLDASGMIRAGSSLYRMMAGVGGSFGPTTAAALLIFLLLLYRTHVILTESMRYHDET